MSESAVRTFFAVATVLTAGLGAAYLIVPEVMLAQWGVPDPDPITVYMSRRYAVMFLGYATLLWLGRTATASPAGKAICAGGAVVTSAMAVLSAWGPLSGVVGPFAWSAAAIEVVLAVCFARAWARA
jgi:hypothetical protein